MSPEKLLAALTGPRARALALCSLLMCALFAVTAFVKLPFTLEYPGVTADVLGSYHGKQVITITGAPVRATSGQLLAVTISATNPGQKISFNDALDAWGDPLAAVVPSDQVYPQGDPAKAEQETAKQMTESQDAATLAALNYLHLSPDQVKVTVDLGDIGGPSAGQMLTLGIIDKLAGDGKGGDLTGGMVIAGTGTVTPDGRIGAVGGVPLKTQAAARDGATVFLVPRGECSDAKVNTPAGLRLVPVETVSDATAALAVLRSGGDVPRC